MVPSMASPQLSVIIPAYNEEARLPRYLEQITAYLDNRKINYEIIVVDDGSSDATARVVQTLSKDNSRLLLLRFPGNRGKGAAVRAGMLAASGVLRLFADADGATPIAELERLEQAIAGGTDVAVASRALRDQATRVKGTVHRKVMGTLFNLMVQALAVPGIRDTQCGFKLFTERAVNGTFSLQTIDDFGFDVEILYLARKGGFRIAEVPVNWTDIPGSKVRLGRDSLSMLGSIMVIRRNDMLSQYRVEGVST
jgi:dolichyl-phosphate beta-glucosyltransferase